MEKRLKNIQTFEQKTSELNISDVMKRIYLLVEEHNQLKIELDKSEEEMEELIDNGWDYIKLIGRKNEIEKAFDVIGLKYVS